MSKTDGKKEVIDKIRRWISEEGLNSASIDNAYADFHVDIGINSFKVNVIINKNKIDSLIIYTKSDFSTLDQKAYSGLSKDDKRSFTLDLKFSLSQLNIAYAIQPDENNIKSIYMQKVIYFDGLTKDKFFDTIFYIVSGINVVSLTYEEHLHSKSDSNSFMSFML